MKKRKVKFDFAIFKEPKRESHSGHILYLMINVPFFLFCKIGIGYDAWKRAKQVDRDVWGFPFPVMVLFLPGAYRVEQDLHRLFKIFNIRYYKGDGSSEWFWLIVAPVVFALMVSGWIGYVWLFDLAFKTDFHTAIIHKIVDLCIWAYHKLTEK